MNTATLERSTAITAPEAFTLTPDQQSALDSIKRFLLDPVEKVFVLSGYSGCGKSTLIRTLMDQLPNIQKTLKLINPSHQELVAHLTATTNKAAENLSQITGMAVETIHSALGLLVRTDFKTNVTTLSPRRNHSPLDSVLLFIDEASYVDKELLGLVFTRTHNCKVIFIGDPAQLTPVKAVNAPVFEAGFSGAALTTVVRQAEGNPIVDLATKFRHLVNTGEFSPFTPDGHHIQRLERPAFNAAIRKEFVRPDWRYRDSKILAWTNKCVIAYNQGVRNLVKGDPHFQEGDYAVCNSFVMLSGGKSIKTDQLVQLTKIDPDTEHHGVEGNWMELDHSSYAFQPKSLEAKNKRASKARAAGEIGIAAEIESSWVDLRGAYACTINKAQGSTYDSVFIDLDDVSKCHNSNQVARMLYVAVSRARHHVYMVGDLA